MFSRGKQSLSDQAVSWTELWLDRPQHEQTGSRRSSFVITCYSLLVTLILTLPTASGERLELVKVSHPDLSRFEPGVRERIRIGIEQLANANDFKDEKEKSSAYGHLAMVYHTYGLVEPAKQSYANAIALDESEFAWQYLLAYLYHIQGDFEPAIRWYHNAVRLKARYLPAWVHLGQAQLEIDDIYGARESFENAIGLSETNAAALSGLASVESRQRNFDHAIELIHSAIASEPAAKQLHYQLAMVYRQAGEREKAREQLALHGPRRPSLTDPILGRMQSLNETSQVFLSRGLEAYRRGDYEEAANQYQKALAASPDDPSTYLVISWVLELAGRQDEAIQYIDKALEIDPTMAMAHFNKGAILESSGDDRRAIEHYRIAVERDPDAIPARQLLANALMRTGDYSGASAQYEAVGQVTPQDMLVMYRGAIALLMSGRCVAASQQLERAFEQDPGQYPIASALVRSYAVCAKTPPDDRELALQLATRLMQQTQRLDSAESVAMILAATGRFEDAAALQRKILDQIAAGKTREEWVDLLKTNLSRYENNEAPVQPYATGSPELSPPRVTLEVRKALAAGI